jgi:biotin carboxyl carrier protein
MPEVDPLQEARALLLQFERSDLKAVHVATEWLEFFASRDRAWSARGRVTGLAPANANAPTHIVAAPHLGTLEAPLAEGSAVTEGTVLARLRVLDRLTDLIADRDGTVADCPAAEGDLIEYGQPLFAIT